MLSAFVVNKQPKGTSMYAGKLILVAIIKKRLLLKASLYTILQILSLTTFEKMPLYDVLSRDGYKPNKYEDPNQLTLFD